MAAEKPELALEVVRELSQAGNPWPMISLLWGDVITLGDYLKDPGEYRSRVGTWLLLDPWQAATISAVMDPAVSQTFVKGATGVGKGAISSLAVIVYFVTWPDAKVVITRDTYQTAVSQAFGEVAKWWRKSRIRLPGALLDSQIKVDSEHWCKPANPLTDEGFSGIHGAHVLFYFDEATAVPESKWKMAATQATSTLGVANPRDPSGDFRQMFAAVGDPDVTQRVYTADGWRQLVTATTTACANVRAKRLLKPVAPKGGIVIAGREYRSGETIPRELWLEHAAPIVPGQTTFDTFLGLSAKPDKRWVGIMVHAKFPDSDPENAIFHREWITAANDKHSRWLEAFEKANGRDPVNWWKSGAARPGALKAVNRINPFEAAGLDVARSSEDSHGDPSKLTLGGSRGVRRIWTTHERDSTELVLWAIEKMADECPGIDPRSIPIGIDASGLGGPICDIARRAGMRVVECLGSASSTRDPKKYANKRAENYLTFGDRLNPEGSWPHLLKKPHTLVFALPEDQELTQELLAHEKVRKGDDKLGVTPKRVADAKEGVPTIVGRIGRSPDTSDSLMYMWEALERAGESLEDWLKAGAFADE